MVIAIIGILSAVVITSLNSSRLKARDARRIVELRQIRLALELYYDSNGYYPQSSCGWDCNGYKLSYDSSWNSLAADLAPYIASLPKDTVNSSCTPWNSGDCFSYAYGNVGRNTYGATYDLTAHFEDPGHPLRCGLKNYLFYFSDSNWCTAFGGGYSNQIYEVSPD